MHRSTKAARLVLLLGVLALPASSSAQGEAYIHAPLPPTLEWRRPPEVIVVPRSEVYYARSFEPYDLYRYRRRWYLNHDGYWYRSRSYEGPFHYIPHDELPLAILDLPQRYRHYPLYPAQKPHQPHQPHQPRQPKPPHQPRQPNQPHQPRQPQPPQAPR